MKFDKHFPKLTSAGISRIADSYRIFKNSANIGTVLVYFTDPVKQLELRLLSRYWHFLDYLWIYLMVFFWANFFIQVPK